MTKRLFVVVVTLGFAALIVACGPAAPPPAPPERATVDLSADVMAIREIDAQWLKAAQARDAAGEAKAFASDGVAYREHRLDHDA